MQTIEYIKKKIKERAIKRKKGNILEQPWSSALWDRLQDLPGERHRTDQCRFKACDEEGNPILKPTGLGATSSSTVWLAMEDILVENMAGVKEQVVARTARHLRQYTLRVYAKPDKPG